ncbi:hypothetical protein EVAR_50429_1 [Eumeta japonica]|uniref:Uncharacterized protein n=1 Tax=Eumeta variegata TaxID=151549 RepID=A0A4C1WY42_EUMVA|nr:hypothetical protein EVAR_50429_1 [Eumeta japonica]
MAERGDYELRGLSLVGRDANTINCYGKLRKGAQKVKHSDGRRRASRDLRCDPLNKKLKPEHRAPASAARLTSFLPDIEGAQNSSDAASGVLMEVDVVELEFFTSKYDHINNQVNLRH